MNRNELIKKEKCSKCGKVDFRYNLNRIDGILYCSICSGKVFNRNNKKKIE